MTTPIEELEKFISNLPVTIRNWIAHVTAAYYLGEMPTSPEHADATLFQALQPTTLISEIRNILLLRASVDYLLADDPISDEARQRTIAATVEKFDAAHTRTMQAQEPLQRAHTRKARDQWAVLRANQLSDQEIRRFERTRLVNNV